MGKADAAGSEKPAKKSGIGCLWRAVIGVVVLGVIVLVAGSILVRLDGVRSAITERMEVLLGEKLKVETIRVGWPWALVLENVSTVNYAVGQPGFTVREIRIRAGTRTPWHVTVRRCTLCLVKTGSNWKPDMFGRLGELPSRNIGEVSKVTEPFRRNVSVSVSDSAVRWFDSSGKELASVSGMAFEVVPVDIPSRLMFYHAIAIHSVSGLGARPLQEMEREWLAADGIRYRLIHQDGPELMPGDKAFWEVSE
jgi:hypothetical protein